MHGLHASPETPVERREDARILSGVLDELYFRRQYRVGNGAYAGASTSITIARSATVLFPGTAGGAPSWRIQERRLDRWQRAGARFTIAYTSDAASTNNFVFFLRISGSNDGDLVTALTDYVTAVWLLPGPAVASTRKKKVVVDLNPLLIPGDKELLHMRFVRDKTNVADTNPNDLHVFSIDMEVLPQI